MPIANSLSMDVIRSLSSMDTAVSYWAARHSTPRSRYSLDPFSTGSSANTACPRSFVPTTAPPLRPPLPSPVFRGCRSGGSRAHPTCQAPAEWTTRTHAPHPQTGGHHSPRQLTIRTATPLHPLPPRIQPRKAARSPGPEYTSGNLPALLAAFTQKAATATLSRTLGSATRQQQRGRTMEGRSSVCQLYTEKTIRRI